MKNLPLFAVVFGVYLALAAGAERHLDLTAACDLICLNGGSCQLSSDAEVALGHPRQSCDCPEGYGGITCEYVAEQCGFVETGLVDAAHDAAAHEDDAEGTAAEAAAPEKRYCMHGAPCKMTVDAATQQQIHTCDCDNAIEAGAYAGQSCEHKATSYCR